VAVITGAASGIGYGLAERFAKEEMKVVLADVEENALAQAERNIKEMGVTTLAVKTDVSKAEDVKSLADKTLDRFGVVHLLCNNAGVSAGPHRYSYRHRPAMARCSALSPQSHRVCWSHEDS
jgi:NAD(P)-dependent dehydrogenase (short-subunit alcohol dehydrogenase family)